MVVQSTIYLTFIDVAAMLPSLSPFRGLGGMRVPLLSGSSGTRSADIDILPTHERIDALIYAA
jgi:hypothetical protein